MDTWYSPLHRRRKNRRIKNIVVTVIVLIGIMVVYNKFDRYKTYRNVSGELAQDRNWFFELFIRD